MWAGSEAVTGGIGLRRWAVYVLIAGFAAWCIVHFHQDLSQIELSRLAGAWQAVLAAGLLSLLNYALRVMRWNLYLRQLGHRLPWGFVGLSFMAGFAFTLSPGKLGEMVRARYYRPLGVPLPGLAAGFFVERLLDLVAMILLALLVLAELQAYRQVLWIAAALVFGLVAVLAAAPWARLSKVLATGDSPSRLARLAGGGLTTLASARQFLRPGLLAPALLLSVVAWGAEAAGLKIVGDAISAAPLGWASAAGIYAVAIIVGALSFLPGGLGSTEAVMVALLYAHGYTMPEAMLLTLVCRLLTLWLAVVIGWLCVWILRSHVSVRHVRA